MSPPVDVAYIMAGMMSSEAIVAGFTKEEALAHVIPNMIFMLDTGIEDVKGEPIFDSDIVKIDRYNEVYEVVYKNGSFQLRGPTGNFILLGDFASEVRIIGNIHQHPGRLAKR